ncbi:TMEM165/GDT1 family protein [Oscillatoria sp. FACHB-1406]|uniref:TMEM165/GDT1 family protein n=1 Tax=Oscillatoria sp. FACHB-1406 TaxID=2692846 RepID=UPI001684F27F|nr:TMEM165/GDT1 family protein [Oscillatoria sp. FACHB-1406]
MSLLNSPDSSQSDRLDIPAPQKSDNKPAVSFGTVFGSTFAAIFLAEMGDKTQLATLLMSAHSDSPWIVFLGSSLALISTSLLGVVLGYWLAKRVSQETMHLAAGTMLMVVSVLLLWDVVVGG